MIGENFCGYLILLLMVHLKKNAYLIFLSFYMVQDGSFMINVVNFIFMEFNITGTKPNWMLLVPSSIFFGYL